MNRTPPDRLLRALDANGHRSTHPTGRPRLREAIAASLARAYGLDDTLKRRPRIERFVNGLRGAA